MPARPLRIVSLTPATTETLFAVGAGPRVVGRTDADDYPAGVASVATVVTLGKVDVEKIVGLQADLVLAGGDSFTAPDVVTRLRSLGIPVAVVTAKDVAGVFHDIEIVAALTGDAPAGHALASAMDDQVRAISQAATAAAGSTRPRVFYEIDAQAKIYCPPPDSFLAAMIALVGGDPVTATSPDWSIPLERLLLADPQVIVLGDAAYGVAPDQVVARTGWSGVSAVKSGAIRAVDDTVVTRPGPRLVQGLASLALAINPNLQLPPGVGAGGTPGPAATATPAASATAAP